MPSAVSTPLPFNPADLPREQHRHYIPATEADLKAMLAAVGVAKLDDLYAHVPAQIRMQPPLALPEELAYDAVKERIEEISQKNANRVSFIGDGLPAYKEHEISGYVCGLRNLATAYTPYQPERSQGTLLTHWIYQCLLFELTGFEAINSSLYDRASALYEAICCSIRLSRNADTALVSEGLFPGDIEVLRTMAADTTIRIETVPVDPATGRLDPAVVRARATQIGSRLACVAFPQVNNLGLLEDVDALTDTVAAAGVKSIAVIDPMLHATDGLKTPATFGQKGADIIVGEGQHLAIAPSFGGPGLGLFGVRFNDAVKNDVRATPGRFVGKARDLQGRECCVMVLSTREQHIRKEKATSNICSNQAFIATLAGASVLARGEAGMAAAVRAGRDNAREAAAKLTAIPGVALAYPEAPFFNELVLKVPGSVADLVSEGCRRGIHVGVDVSSRVPNGRNLIKVSFSDLQTSADVAKLVDVFAALYGAPKAGEAVKLPEVPAALLRATPAGLPQLPLAKIKDYYRLLSELNVSPDNGCYPLGSCTMKYNPFLNEWAAGLPGFTNAHPQAPVEDVQGCLEVLFEIQEWIKGVTGLAGVTTQPLAGAQGELVGLKLFQAYHRSRGESHRDVLLIPKSAHGTNFATAAMAGFDPREVNGLKAGIVLLEGDASGRIDMADLDKKIAAHGPRLAGIMVTNPNTSGILETEFKAVADKVHAAGGLVYMDGANMNAIAGWLNLGTMGVDAVHNNLHKTWTIPHGGGGPGDAIVAVSEKLVDFLPGYQIVRKGGLFQPVRAPKSIGSFHRHWGNFAHKVRAYTYLLRLGREGVRRMSAVAVLSSRYLYARLSKHFPTLPAGAASEPRMHEFILTLSQEDFARLEAVGVPRASAISRVGKLFLDFGFHAPTVAWPEVFGLMIEPTESYTRAELDRLGDAVMAIQKLIREHPEALLKTPYFTPVDRIDDVTANRNLVLSERLESLPTVNPNRLGPDELAKLPIAEIYNRIVAASAS